MTSRSDRPLIIWRLTDGKPGHEKQTLGLAHALLRNRPGECFDLAAPARGTALLQWMQGRFPAGNGLAKPDIILAAGHATHFALLAARRAFGGKFGGKAVVLMKPSLPLSLFDLCVIPEHDKPPRRRNVAAIRGVLNDVQISTTRSPDQGLMLIGGISSHYRWDDAAVGAAVAAIALASPLIAWQLTTSRRTPANFLDSLPQPLPDNLRLIPHHETGPGWLEQALAQAGQVWVTEDSVSMLYEALTAGAGVGLLRLCDPQDSRVRRGVEKLLADGWVTPYEAWQTGQTLKPLAQSFNEAERIADLILEKLLDTPAAKHSRAA
ncbi:MAG: mitochondrial fission ELM1 family protein [Pseudomonadota bacterium]|nr:mitochondrial fission ELM1 family protein [Pseudomonadota bacterium]